MTATQATTPGPLSVGDRVVAVADLRKHPDGPVWVQKGEEVGIVREYGIDNCIAGVALQDGREGDWAKSCFRLAPTAPVEASGSEREAVARIIDPLAWATWDEVRQARYGSYDLSGEPEGRTEDPTCRRWAHKERINPTCTKSLAKADAILALGGQQGEVSVRDMRLSHWTEVEPFPALAEAQDEGAAKPWGWVISNRRDGKKWFSQDHTAVDAWVSDPDFFEVTPVYRAHPSPTPAADADRVRELEDVLRNIALMDCYTREDEEPIHMLMMRLASDALKSTAAKEGGEA